jgi:hypothetical protein
MAIDVIGSRNKVEGEFFSWIRCCIAIRGEDKVDTKNLTTLLS